MRSSDIKRDSTSQKCEFEFQIECCCRPMMYRLRTIVLDIQKPLTYIDATFFEREITEN